MRALMNTAQLRLSLAAPRPAAGFVSRRVAIGGLHLHIRERAGHGRAWVLLHGLAVSHRYLMPTATALPGPVSVPDLPGFGLSARPIRAYDTEQHAEVVARWMTEAGVAGACLLANSYGCQVAVELAVRRPELVAALILVGPTVDPAARSVPGQFGRWVRDVLLEDPREAMILAADVRDAGLRRVYRTLRHSVRHRIDPRLPRVAAPTLVLRGARDPIAPARWVTEAAALAPDGAAGTVPRAAHNAITTAGPAVAAQALAFVRRHGLVD